MCWPLALSLTFRWGGRFFGETMTDHEAQIRGKLLSVEDAIATLTRQLSELEGHRDRLLQELTDLEGAHDRRFVPVR